MNKIIKRELEKIHAPLPEYDDNTTHIIIPKKQTAASFELEVGNSYVVELARYILFEPPNFTLSSNWNRGVVPKSQTLTVNVLHKAGKMIKVCGRGIDLNSNAYLEDIYQELWLPVSGVKVLYQI